MPRRITLAMLAHAYLTVTRSKRGIRQDPGTTWST